MTPCEETSEDLRSWLVLHAIPGLGPAAYCALLQHYKTPAAVLTASKTDLCAIPGIGRHTARAVCTGQDWQGAADQIARASEAHVRILTLHDPHYPAHLKQIHAPPPILFSRGRLDLASAPTIALVGSRSFTPYGRETARRLAADLARAGIAVVSGMASGIDTHAHRGALDAEGPTIAVLGSGLDCPYPPENWGLYREICRKGLVLSEFFLGVGPEAHNFPRRNRIISGLSLGTVVIEAGDRSGALITAQFALDQNREVFAVPGPINSGKSRGPNRLIREGAQLVRGVEDILAEIAPQLRPTPVPPATPLELTDLEQRVWQALESSETRHVDDIAQSIEFSSAQTLEVLLALELKNLVEQVPGMRYRRR